jgi:EmrB/QacA subfamily drug resistance transporter
VSNTQSVKVDYSKKWFVMATIGSGVILATIDGSIVNIALPTIRAEFDTAFRVIQWVPLAYLLVIATLTLGTGRLGDIIGKKRIYTTGFVVFTFSSMLCGLAPSIGFLIGFRVIQALGAVMILALGAAILTESFPPQERGKALGWIGTFVSIGIVTGPAVGGLLISTLDWRWIFYVNLPVGIIGTLMAIRYVPNLPPAPGQRMDFLGAGILSVTLLSISYALTRGQEAGFLGGVNLILYLVAVIGAVTFVRVERRLPSPMIRLDLFRNPMLTISVITGFITFVVVSAVFLVMPFYLEGVLGFDVKTVGLLLGSGPLVLGVVAPLSGTLSDRIGIRRLTLAGLSILAVTYLAFQILDTDTRWWEYVMLAVPVGLGMGVFQSPNNSAIMGAMPREYSGLGAGMLAITRLLGQITGVAVLGSFWAARVLANSPGPVPNGDASRASAAAQVAGIHDAFLAGFGAMLLAVAIGYLGLRRERQMRPVP